MRFKNILLLCKRSPYFEHLQRRERQFPEIEKEFLARELARFKDSHEQHVKNLKAIRKIFKKNDIKITECFRGEKINYSDFDLIVTIGGDGTFLEAAHNAREQVILGVNSAPQYSIGRFCVGRKSNIQSIVSSVRKGTFKIGYFQRIRLESVNPAYYIDALNDILICHQNPAMLCRYYLKVGSRRESQRSSGVWVSTATGSTGAAKSAGGRVLPQFAKKFQYLPRELYVGKSTHYQLKGSVLNPGDKIEIVSLMSHGVIYFDGAHRSKNFSFGHKVMVKLSPHPLRTLVL